MSALSIVGVAGNITRPSRTSALVSALLAEIRSLSSAQTRLLELADLGPHLFHSFAPERLPAEARSAIHAIETADALVVGSPVFKGSYTGAFKHLFDLVRPNALTGKLVLLTATGGSPMHGLVTEHQLRPLFGYFNALTLPTTIFALESDFRDYRIDKPELTARIGRAASEIVDLLEAHFVHSRALAARATA
jgi:FMN reductase